MASIIALDVGHPSFFGWKDAAYYFVKYQAWLVAAYLVCRLTARTPFADLGQSLGDRMARVLAQYIGRDHMHVTGKAPWSKSVRPDSLHPLNHPEKLPVLQFALGQGMLSLFLLLYQLWLVAGRFEALSPRRPGQPSPAALGAAARNRAEEELFPAARVCLCTSPDRALSRVHTKCLQLLHFEVWPEVRKEQALPDPKLKCETSCQWTLRVASKSWLLLLQCQGFTHPSGKNT